MTGGKKSWREVDAIREESLQVFREHRRSELRLQLTEISSSLTEQSLINVSKAKRCEWILSFYRKVFLFNLLNPEDEQSIASQIYHFNCECLGLDEFIKKHSTTSPTAVGATSSSPPPLPPPPPPICPSLGSTENMKGYYTKCIDSDGFMNFGEIFSNGSQSLSTNPIKLEICAGNGDWIVSQVIVLSLPRKNV